MLQKAISIMLISDKQRNDCMRRQLGQGDVEQGASWRLTFLHECNGHYQAATTANCGSSIYYSYWAVRFYPTIKSFFVVQIVFPQVFTEENADKELTDYVKSCLFIVYSHSFL